MRELKIVDYSIKEQPVSSCKNSYSESELLYKDTKCWIDEDFKNEQVMFEIVI